jgi:hypothetical protein
MATQIPSERVPPIAKEVASARSTWAMLVWFGAAIMLIGGLTIDDPDLGRGAFLAGATFWAVVLFIVGLRQHKGARRANEAARRATEQTASFVLAGNELLAYDAAGVSQPDASIRITHRQLTMLTALPKAEIRQ